MLPAIRHLVGDVLVFQQDSAPAHRARATVEYLHQATSEFISPDLWPPNSPDLNPLNYKSRGCVQECMYQKPICDMDQQKQHLVEVWSDVQQTAVDAAIGEWRKRLRACICAKGHHLNICFNFFMLSVVC